MLAKIINKCMVVFCINAKNISLGIKVSIAHAITSAFEHCMDRIG